MKLKQKIFLITAILFVIFAIIMLVVGYALIGADIGAWFTSRYAIWCYVLGGIWIIAFIGSCVWDRIKRL